MKAYVEAYGCTLNHGEAREIEDFLFERGWEIVAESDEADLVVLATCVVIESTERAMLKRLRELKGAKSLVVTGCLASAGKEKAAHVAPNALFVPPGDLRALSKLIDSTLPTGASRPARDSYAIVPIATGCRGKCSYCITRLARGDLKSRGVDRIIEAVRREATSGPREIQLTAQDTAAYGADIDTDLPSLVERVCSLPLDFRLRVGMMNPKSALPIVDRIGTMYLQNKVFKFLHLPIQSASDRLLEDMGRGYTVDEFKHVVDRTRSCVPRMTVSTDIIVGYPGESQSDHSLNLRLIKDVRPDIVNVTRFSARPGTEAASSSGTIVGWKAKERSREIADLRFKIAYELNKSWVGETVTALSTERGKVGSTVMRNDEYKQIVVPGALALGKFHKITIVDATPTYLMGEKVGP